MKGTVLKNNLIESNRENSVFQLFFLINNEKQDIEVVEMREIDFTEVRKHLEKGESVCITCKRKQKLQPSRVVSEETLEPWYFTHF